MSNEPNPRRSLILAGGGVKVAFQAGVMQVWLDECGIAFDHADGASGGAFNLAMYCQGLTGTEIANNWRDLPILKGVAPNLYSYLKLYWAESLLTYDAWKRNILTRWRLDWDKIRASRRDATFNLYNFSKNTAEVREPSQMSEDALIACVSLPMWFPPVKLENGDTYIDAVYATDANLIEAVRRGADELWIIWTVSEKGEWRNGFVANYFQIIEASANSRLRADLARIQANNDAVARGEGSEFGRPIEVKLLRAEVPLHYLINFSAKGFTEAVELGIDEARRWCQSQGISRSGPAASPAARPEATTLQFTEEMKGYVTAGAADHESGASGAQRSPLSVRLTVKVADVDEFIASPAHAASIEGQVTCPLYGGQRVVTGGEVNLFVDAAARGKRMLYRVHFSDSAGNEHTLFGRKEIRDDPVFDVWTDTTTLFTRVYAGRLNAEPGSGAAAHASGIIRIHLRDFMQQLTTFRTTGASTRARALGLAEFGKFFFGAIWDVYARFVSASA